MESQNAHKLKEELEQFRKEKEKIRNIIGSIGGVKDEKRDAFITKIFTFTIIVLFFGDIVRYILHIDIPLPPLFSIHLGVLLVSIKIIWMIHKQSRVEHFQFWILNSIEFRLNDLSQQMREKKIKKEEREEKREETSNF